MATEVLRQFGDQMSNVGDSTVRQLYQATDGNAVTLSPYDRSVLVTMDDSADMALTLPHPSETPVGAIIVVELKSGASTNDLTVAGAGTTAYASGDIDTAAEKVVVLNTGLRWLQLNSAL